MVVVRTTKIIESLFLAAKAEISDFCDLFRDWKSLGEAGEDEVYEFGKNVPYERPLVNGEKNVLMHVHLVPILDLQSKQQWDKSWERRSRRTSNRALVYVDDGRGNFLLLDIIPEPNAHDIPKMLTIKNKEIMEYYAEIADQFIYFGRIIA